MVEYSLDIKVPEHVWDHPMLREMSKAVIDIMTWPNVRLSLSTYSFIIPLLILTHWQDLCSFNVTSPISHHTSDCSR